LTDYVRSSVVFSLLKAFETVRHKSDNAYNWICFTAECPIICLKVEH